MPTFFKYRHQYAHGWGDWEFQVDDADPKAWRDCVKQYKLGLPEFLLGEGVIDDPSWSDKYRTTEAVFVPASRLPKRELQAFLKSARSQAKRYTERVKTLEALEG